MKNIFVMSIDNLRTWRRDHWAKYELNQVIANLRIQYDQLMITAENKVLESLNIKNKIKGILKDDVLILIINSTGQGIRKIKFRLKDNVSRCIQYLGTCFPIVNYNVITSRKKFTPKYSRINNILKEVFKGKAPLNNLTLPEEFGNFIKLCLVDPMFAQITQETEKILKKQMSNED